MMNINHEDFFGLEIYSDKKDGTDRHSFFRRTDQKVTVVAPSQTPMKVSTR